MSLKRFQKSSVIGPNRGSKKGAFKTFHITVKAEIENNANCLDLDLTDFSTYTKSMHVRLICNFYMPLGVCRNTCVSSASLGSIVMKGKPV